MAIISDIMDVRNYRYAHDRMSGHRKQTEMDIRLNRHKEVNEMAMDVSSIGSIGAQQIQEVQKTEKAAKPSESQDKSREGADLSISSATTQNQQSVKVETQNGDSSGNSNTPTRQERTEEQIEAENKRVKQAISEMNKKMFNNSEAVFGIHEDTNRITIKIVDKTTKETIKELPPEKTLDMIAKAWELAGLMVDERG